MPIEDFLKLVYPYDYTGLIIRSFTGETIYQAYGDDLTPIFTHLREYYQDVMQCPLNFFLTNVHDINNVTLVLSLTSSYVVKRRGKPLKRFDFRVKNKDREVNWK